MDTTANEDGGRTPFEMTKRAWAIFQAGFVMWFLCENISSIYELLVSSLLARCYQIPFKIPSKIPFNYVGRFSDALRITAISILKVTIQPACVLALLWAPIFVFVRTILLGMAVNRMRQVILVALYITKGRNAAVIWRKKSEQLWSYICFACFFLLESSIPCTYYILVPELPNRTRVVISTLIVFAIDAFLLVRYKGQKPRPLNYYHWEAYHAMMRIRRDFEEEYR